MIIKIVLCAYDGTGPPATPAIMGIQDSLLRLCTGGSTHRGSDAVDKTSKFILFAQRSSSKAKKQPNKLVCRLAKSDGRT